MSSVLITKPEMPLFSAPASSGGKPIFFDGFIDDFKLEALLQRFGLHACQEFKIHYSASNVVIATVGPDGGELPFSDGSVTMTIPEGALEHPKLIHCFREVPKAGDLGQLNGPNGKRVLMFSPKFNCGPDGTCFKKPVTLRFRHSFSSRGKDRTGGLKVYTRGGEKTDFDRDETGSFSIDGDWMEIKTSHFSDVAVGEDVEEENYEEKSVRRTSGLMSALFKYDVDEELRELMSAVLEYDVVEELKELMSAVLERNMAQLESERRTSEFQRVCALLERGIGEREDPLKRKKTVSRPERNASIAEYWHTYVPMLLVSSNEKQIDTIDGTHKQIDIESNLETEGKFKHQGNQRSRDEHIDILDENDTDAVEDGNKERHEVGQWTHQSQLHMSSAQEAKDVSKCYARPLCSIDDSDNGMWIFQTLAKSRGSKQLTDMTLDINVETYDYSYVTPEKSRSDKEGKEDGLTSDIWSVGRLVLETLARTMFRGTKAPPAKIDPNLWGYRKYLDGLLPADQNIAKPAKEKALVFRDGSHHIREQRGRLPQEEFCVFPKKLFSFFF